MKEVSPTPQHSEQNPLCSGYAQYFLMCFDFSFLSNKQQMSKKMKNMLDSCYLSSVFYQITLDLGLNPK